jgi:hypothetical protein
MSIATQIAFFWRESRIDLSAGGHADTHERFSVLADAGKPWRGSRTDVMFGRIRFDESGLNGYDETS